MPLVVGKSKTLDVVTLSVHSGCGCLLCCCGRGSPSQKKLFLFVREKRESKNAEITREEESSTRTKIPRTGLSIYPLPHSTILSGRHWYCRCFRQRLCESLHREWSMGAPAVQRHVAKITSKQYSQLCPRIVVT